MIKFAQFGAGFIGKIHGANIANHPRAELAYIYDVNTAAAEQLAAQLGHLDDFDPAKEVAYLLERGLLFQEHERLLSLVLPHQPASDVNHGSHG